MRLKSNLVLALRYHVEAKSNIRNQSIIIQSKTTNERNCNLLVNWRYTYETELVSFHMYVALSEYMKFTTQIV